MPETWELRTQFATSLSRMYGCEVPAYATLVAVTEEVNRDCVAATPDAAQRLGSIARVTAERHGAIRVGTPAELRDTALLFTAFGMYPVGFYDLRTAATPIPVVSTAFRPISADELARNPFRVFTSMLTTADRRFFTPDLRARVEAFLAQRNLYAPELLALARTAIRDGGLDEPHASRLVALATAAFALSDTPIERSWYTELERVSSVAADIAGVTSTHINHLTPRVLDIDELYRRMSARGITMIDAIQGPPRWAGPDVLLRQTSFRALAEPRRFTDGMGALRVRFGEVEARGIALTRAGREGYDDAMATGWPGRLPASEAAMFDAGLAYYTREPSGARKPIVYEDFLPASAAGIFQSNLTSGGTRDDSAPGETYDLQWLSDAIDAPVADPFDLYQAQQDNSERQSHHVDTRAAR